MKFSIAAWNMNYRGNGDEKSEAMWRHLEDNPIADIMLLQECKPPKDFDEGRLIFSKADDRGEWGTAIFCKDLPIERIDVKESHKGSLALGEVSLEDTTITAISVYGMFERINGVEWASTCMHRIISDITPLLYYDRNTRLFAMGGDYNVSTQWNDRYATPSHKLIFDRLEDLSLVNATMGGHGRHLHTYKPRKGNREWQNDYLHLSKRLYQSMNGCDVLTTQLVDTMSDHRPVVAYFEI